MGKAFGAPTLRYVYNVSDIPSAELAGLSDEALLKLYRQCLEHNDDLLFQVNPEVVVRQVGDEWVLVPTGNLAQLNNGMITINSTSYFLWKQFEKPNSIRRVLQAARAEYDDPLNLLETEIRNFVDGYLNMRLLGLVSTE